MLFCSEARLSCSDDDQLAQYVPGMEESERNINIYSVKRPYEQAPYGDQLVLNGSCHNFSR